jgi:hypothetical protein
LFQDSVIGPNVKTILCYEFHEEWHSGLEVINSDKWTYKNIGLCRWFMISSPKEELFLKCYKRCIKIIDNLINIDLNSDDYHYNMINLSGPLMLTRKLINNMHEKIAILPSEYFCAGSWDNKVPVTEKSYIKHHYTYSWEASKNL